MKYEEILRTTNWSELAEQKKALLKQAKSTTGSDSAKLNNLVKWIEKIQDAATDEYGVPIDEVHPIAKRIKLIKNYNDNKN